MLGIETTCDETAVAVVRDGREVLSSIIASQADLHAEFGGVVPELSCRRHVDCLIPLIDEALNTANLSLDQIDLIAVAHGPGLIGALLIGLTAAKTLSLATGKPFIGVNHVEAHLYAAIMSHKVPKFPTLGAVLSGGHTSLVLMNEIGNYTLIGETVDDAIGEAFDKVAKILGLPYPGGPQIEQLARHGNRHQFSFKPGKIKERPLDFSFSGLKTSVLYALKNKDLTPQNKADAAAAFQYAALIDVVEKTALGSKQHNCQTIVFGGGVTNNRYLRELVASLLPEKTVLWPSPGLSLDNAAMIAGLGYHHYLKRGEGDHLDLEAQTRIAL